jgi:hypothetical protein
MRSLSTIVALASVAALAAACSAAPPGELDGQQSQAVENDAMHIHWQKGARPGGGGGGGASNLVDHGGRVLASSNTYAIWWGSQRSFPADAESGIDALFEGLNSSSFLGISTQYMRGDGGVSSSSFHTNLTDASSSPPSRAPSTSTIVNEACKVINANRLTADPSALYLVYTSNFPAHVNYCAWHSDGTCNGVTIQVAYMPNTTGIGGCDPGNLYNCNTYTQGTRSLTNVSSHEFMEAVTDPDLNAWYDSSGSEIGDKCAWQFTSCVNLTTGNWQLQEEWSNSASGCVQQ